MMKFGIIGDPVSHSKSPVLFRAAYGGAWPYELIEGSDFETSWRRFLEEYTGINVTAPFKALAFRKADIATVATARIGAANLIVKTPQGTEAHNSDFSGVILSVREALAPGCAPAPDETVLGEVRDLLPNLYPTRPEALVIGCGGAGRAAAVAAAEMGFRVRVMNRTYLKAVDLCREMPEMDFEAVPADRLREAVRKQTSSSIPRPVLSKASWTLRKRISRGWTRMESLPNWSWRPITKTLPSRAESWRKLKMPVPSMFPDADGFSTRPFPDTGSSPEANPTSTR